MTDDPGTGRRASVAALAVTIGVTLTAGLLAVRDRTADGGPRPVAQAGGPVVPDTGAVAAILARRARAVRDGDRTAFLATVGSAAPQFQNAQRTLFDNLTRLPMRSWEERLDSPVPATTGAGVAMLKVTLRYRLRGYDRGQVTRTRYLTAAERAGRGWAIVGDGAGHGLRDDPDIFDGGPLRVIRGRSSLVIGAAAPSALREIAGRLDAAVPKVTSVLGRNWRRRVVALVPADTAQAGALLGGDHELADIAALATVTPGDPGADRIVVSPGSFGRLNALGRRVVLTHELAHVATGAARDARTPIWLIEGLADYVGYRGEKVGVRSAARELRREVAAGRLPRELPGGAGFGGGGRMPQAYQEAWLACRMIAERYGESALPRLYDAAGRQPQDAALRAVLGMGTSTFTAQWRAYLTKELT
jgi:hypothetical protein